MLQAGLKTTQYSLLRHVAYQALPVAELALQMRAERTTLTRNLKPLIDAGWVTLLPGQDARQRIVTITDTGRSSIKAAKQAWRVAQTELEQTLGMDMVRALHLDVDTALEQLHPLIEKIEKKSPKSADN
ncbi:hypothetical protein GCM10011396_13430 [Undibacterium terreum]|uniref:HTH marR-type domain-containing protein n=2 Tax=Undibacterium terreum TaxID=1224302 RepID=A0A916UCY3_9BURK|nr:hypothetical protein GCM10011396_13430 [Undibacterium terreum]